MEKLNERIASNIAKFRKAHNLTQFQLAEMINFSDKSVSKWERGDAIPDVEVLMKMCEIFDVTLNDFVKDKEEPIIKKRNYSTRNRWIITLMSYGAVWLVATIVFVMLCIFAPTMSKTWLCFIYAIPTGFVVLLVFSCIWGEKWMQCVSASALIWTVIIAFCLSFQQNFWALIYVGIPLQVITILGFVIKLPKKIKQQKDIDTNAVLEIKNE